MKKPGTGGYSNSLRGDVSPFAVLPGTHRALFVLALVDARGFLPPRLLHEVVPNLRCGAVLAADRVAVDGGGGGHRRVAEARRRSRGPQRPTGEGSRGWGAVPGAVRVAVRSASQSRDHTLAITEPTPIGRQPHPAAAVVRLPCASRLLHAGVHQFRRGRRFASIRTWE